MEISDSIDPLSERELACCDRARYETKRGAVDVLGVLNLRFKLQFNVLELTRLFYDKVKDAQSNELTDLLNKRVLHY